MANKLDCEEHGHVQKEEWDACETCMDEGKIGPCSCAFDMVPLRGPDPDCASCGGTGFTAEKDMNHFGLLLRGIKKKRDAAV